MLKEVFEPIGSVLSALDAEKAKLFDKHIEPLMQNVEMTHRNYLETFWLIRKQLSEKKLPNAELLVFLEERKSELAYLREKNSQVSERLLDADRRVVSPFAWKERGAFCQAVLEYYRVSAEVGSVSWFTDFVNVMKAKLSVGLIENPFDLPSFGNDPRSELIDRIDIIVNQNLPAKLKEVQKSYAKLRVALL